MPKMSSNGIKILWIVLSMLAGNVGTYFGAMASMDKEIALIKQASKLKIGFLEFRISKLESSSPEKLEGRVDALQVEVKTAAKHSITLENLLEKLLE